MKKLIVRFSCLLLFIFSSLSASSASFEAKLLSSTEADSESFIDHVVNVINGDYCEVVTDFVIKGPDDLLMQRYYSNSNYITGSGQGGWRIFPHCWLTVGKDPKESSYDISGTTYHWTYAFTGEKSGSILSYSGWESRTSKDSGLQVWGFRDGKSVCNTAQSEVSGKYNVQNHLLKYQVMSQTYLLKLGDGTERYFEKVDHLPSVYLGEELHLDLSCKVKDPEYFRLALEILPSGNKIRYDYDEAGHLVHIEMLSMTEEKIFSWISVDYDPQKVLITTSDERRISYELQGSLLTEAQYSYQPSFHYSYDEQGRLLHKKTSSDRLVSIEYDTASRVSCLKEQLGDFEEPIPSKTFFYQKQLTEVVNALGQKTVYRFNPRDQLEAIERYDLAGEKYRVDRKFWDSEKECYGRILTETIEDGEGNTVSARCYSYDASGNIIKESLYGNLTGKSEAFVQVDRDGKVLAGEDDDCHVKTMEYSQDGFNLITKIGDCKGNEVLFEYLGRNRLARKYLKDNKRSKWKKIQKRTFFHYNDDGVLIETIEDDGHDLDQKSNDGVSERHTTRRVLKSELPGVGLPQEIVTYVGNPEDSFCPEQTKRCVNTYDVQGRLLKEETYDAHNAYRFTRFWEYDTYGNLIKEIDLEGHDTFYTYDSLGRCIKKEIPHQNVVKQFFYNKQSKVVEARESYGATQHILRTTYDLLGRKTSSTDHLERRTDYAYDECGFLAKIIYPAVIGVDGQSSRPEESYENDLFGHPLVTIDPKGYRLLKRYNLRGNPTSIDYPDGTCELFKYDPEGSVHRHLTRDKIISIFEYDFLGRQVNEERSTLGKNGSGSWIDNLFCQYSLYHLTSVKKSESYICYTYDPAGRPAKIFRPSVSAREDDKNSRKEELSYDALGRVSQKKTFFDSGDNDYIIEYTEYDLGHRITEKTIVDAGGTLLRGARYFYNKKGLLVEEQALLDGHYITQVKTAYNDLGEPVLITDAEGQHTRFVYTTTLGSGSKNVVKTIVDPSGVSTQMEFDAFDRMISLKKISPSKEILSEQSIVYDLSGNKVLEEHCVISPSGRLEKRHTRFVMGPMNRIEEMREAVGTEQERITTYTYGEDGKLAAKCIGKQAPLTYTYSKEGKLYKIQHKSDHKELNVSNTYSYDKRGNVTSAHSLHGKTVTRAYNLFNELTSETFREGGKQYTVEYEYDRKGRVTRVLLPDASIIKYSYDALHGKAVSRISPSGKSVYTHEYMEYDQWGQLKKEQMIGFSGQRTKTFKLNGQLSSTASDFYKEEVPKDGYDLVGNLLQVCREGDFEPQDLSYTYNLLSQLTSEQGEAKNSYSYDSIGNRLTHDEERYSYDPLNQLVSTPSDHYSYTLEGALAQRTRDAQTWEFESNILGQLIHVKKDDDTLVEYSYDPFGRRRLKKHFDASGKRKKTLSTSTYLYLGDQEVGVLDEDGNLLELRVPGLCQQTLSSESVAFELKGEIVVPLYDIRGHVVALIDPYWREVIESYSYSAFGEQIIFDADGNPLKESGCHNPWGYSGKRKEMETALILMGHRYYDPKTGRWINPDPALFIDGPNLYVFSQNNPLHYFDDSGLSSENRHSQEFESYFYGEVETHCFCERHRTCKRGGDLEQECGPEAGLITFFDAFEKIFRNKSRPYDLSDEKKFRTLSKGRILFINGVDTEFEDAKDHARYIGRLAGGYNVHGVYNATHQKAVDAYEYLMNKGYVATPPIRQLHQQWDAFFSISDAETPLLQICHSQGAMQVRNALMCYPKKLRKRIIVVAVAPGGYVNKTLCKDRTHYAAEWNRDFIPWIDIEGRLENLESVVVLESHKDAPDMDHGFQSPTYKKSIAFEIKKYIKNYGN